MQKLIEFVPNFSEGRDMSVIKQITDEIGPLTPNHRSQVAVKRCCHDS
ncbi:MAG: hypothetical protein IPM25_05235 [Chloracidobacterium sp.]|nr:hypothetical protein [Chloracidobacterium sp.]